MAVSLPCFAVSTAGVSNPLVNTHLQGRFDTYPKRRGITRVKELNEAGINVCFGHDDIFDPWYPMGTGNMLEVVHFGLHVCQMMGYDDINESLKFISTNSARTLNIEDKYITVRAIWTGYEEPANMNYIGTVQEPQYGLVYHYYAQDPKEVYG
mgnify:CR=1 FL=1